MNEKSSSGGYCGCPIFVAGLRVLTAGKSLDVTEDGAVEFTEDGEYEPYDDVGEEPEESAVIGLDGCSTKGTAY